MDKLLPPKPSLEQALDILSIPNTRMGINQLLQHIVHEGLAVYIPLICQGININDSNIEQKDAGFDLTYPSLIDSSYGREYKDFTGRVKAGKCLLLTGQDGDVLQVHTFYSDDQEYYPLSIVMDINEELKIKELAEYEKKLKLADNAEEIYYPEDAGHYIAGYKIRKLRPPVKNLTFDREELLAFKKGEFGKLHFTNHSLPPYLDKGDNSYAIELDIAIQAHKAVVVDGWRAKTVYGGFTGHLKEWLEQQYPDVSGALIERIVTVANPKKETSKQKK